MYLQGFPKEALNAESGEFSEGLGLCGSGSHNHWTIRKTSAKHSQKVSPIEVRKSNVKDDKVWWRYV
jgi:hypothetical protein